MPKLFRQVIITVFICLYVYFKFLQSTTKRKETIKTINSKNLNLTYMEFIPPQEILFSGSFSELTLVLTLTARKQIK